MPVLKSPVTKSCLCYKYINTRFMLKTIFYLDLLAHKLVKVFHTGLHIFSWLQWPPSGTCNGEWISVNCILKDNQCTCTVETIWKTYFIFYLTKLSTLLCIEYFSHVYRSTHTTTAGVCLSMAALLNIYHVSSLELFELPRNVRDTDWKDVSKSSHFDVWLCLKSGNIPYHNNDGHACVVCRPYTPEQGRGQGIDCTCLWGKLCKL